MAVFNPANPAELRRVLDALFKSGALDDYAHELEDAFGRPAVDELRRRTATFRRELREWYRDRVFFSSRAEPCGCGETRLSPDFAHDTFVCARCGRPRDVPEDRLIEVTLQPRG